MAGGKLSPRQRMINMMYLVLMALLALNVSNEVLKAFHLLEISFDQNKNNLQSKTFEFRLIKASFSLGLKQQQLTLL